MDTLSGPRKSGAPQTTVAPDQILQVAGGFMASKMLFAANEAGVFEALSGGPSTLKQIAERTGRPARTTRILLDAMVALHFLERDGQLYRNAAVSDAYLTGRSPFDLRAFLRFWNAISYRRWVGLDESVSTGTGAGEQLLTPEEQTIFSEGVATFTKSAAMELTQNYDFAKHRNLLDLGGGTGSFLKIILERYPSLEGTVFDKPDVIVLAQAHLRELGPRAHAVSGDFLTDDIPGAHDVVLLGNVIHYFSNDGNTDLLRRIRKSVTPGATLLLVDWWLNAEHTEPLAAALMSGEFLVHVGGESYSVEDARSWFASTGWRFVKHASLAGPQSLVVAQAS